MAALGFFKPQDYASPEAIKNRRDLLDALTGRIGRAQNVGQGIGDMISGAVIGLSRGRLNRAEGEKTAGANKAWDAFNLFGRPQISPASAQVAPQGVYEPQVQKESVRPSNAPSGDTAAQIYQGLIQRGLPDHVARAALGNMTVESRLNPGINELAPLVKGSRGGFGLNQWTGPRRRAFEAFAAQKGVNPSDLGAQLDFTMQELKGPENAAFRKLIATKTPEEAAMVYSQSFLRPGIPHMNRRLEETRKYAGMDFGAPQQPVQVASNDQAFTPQPTSFQPQAQAQPVLEQPMQAPQPDQSRINELMQLATNPWLDDGKKQMAQMMLQQEMQKQQQATDPMYQMNLQKAQQELQAGTLGMKKTQAELEQMQNPRPEYETVTSRDGSVFRFDKRKGTLDPMYGGKPDPVTPTDDMREFELAQKNPAFAEYLRNMKAAGATQVNLDQKTEGAFDKKLAEGQAEAFNTMATDGLNARADIGLIDQLDGLLQGQGGMGTGFAVAAGKWGIPVTDGMSDLQAADAIISKLVPTQRQPGSGSMSDRDVELFRSSLPSLWNQPGGNQKIIQTMRGLAEYKKAQGEIAQAVQMGVITRQQAVDKLKSLPNPLAEFGKEKNKGRTKSGLNWSVDP